MFYVAVYSFPAIKPHKIILFISAQARPRRLSGMLRARLSGPFGDGRVEKTGKGISDAGILSLRLCEMILGPVLRCGRPHYLLLLPTAAAAAAGVDLRSG